MGESNKIHLLLFVSSMILPAYALDVIISGAHQDFKQRSEINTYIMNGEKKYAGTLNPLTYVAGVNISNVIVYIIDTSRYVEIIRNAVRGIRLQMAEELEQWNYELVFLGIGNFDDDEHNLIGAFILAKIQPHPNQTNQALTIKVIGENRFDRSYQCHFVNYERYQENAHICGGIIRARLRAMQRGALRPIESNNDKFIKLLEYLPPKYYTKLETTWSVRVENGTYLPECDVNAPEYNFRMRHPNEKISVLILNGNEYSTVASLKIHSPGRTQMRKIYREVTKSNEVLFIMGAANFDWSDVYLVAQIILKHTQGLPNSSYNVFACGIGMFNTYYLNWYEDDGRYILQPQNSSVFELIKVLTGEEVKGREINMYHSENRWQMEKMPINLGNGQYYAMGRFTNYTFPWMNRRIAFIVFDSTEVNGPIDYQTVYHSTEELRRSNIYVVVVEAINFELYDIHIIAEWVEEHRGQIDPEQIVVFGGGTFDTIFQSQRNTYKTFFNIGKDELRAIRNAFVKIGNEKKVLAAQIDDENFEAWSYPMNTVVNGVYESDLIPDKNMFDTTGGRKIFFVITSAYNFQQIAAIRNVGAATARFRDIINNQYSRLGWSVFLVGLDNFGERDSRLFAEFVEMQTHDERPLAGFVCVFNYGIKHAVYQYKDTAPFPIDFYGKMHMHFTYSVGTECRLLDETH